MLAASFATVTPPNDSFVVTSVPLGVSVNVHSWMPTMSPALPPQRMREPASSAYTVDVIVMPNVVQRNELPASSLPSSTASLSPKSQPAEYVGEFRGDG